MVPSFSKANDMGYPTTILMWQMYLHTRDALLHPTSKNKNPARFHFLYTAATRRCLTVSKTCLN